MKWIAKPIGSECLEDLLPMRHTLWSHDSLASHRKEVEEFLKRPDFFGFLAYATSGEAVGFIELTLKPHANGCEFSPVLFIEGIWIKESYRRTGVGAFLLQHVEDFARARQIPGLGSDCLVENLISQTAHERWGFQEVERVVCYAKPLKNDEAQLL